jgi:hypothetical protein
MNGEWQGWIKLYDSNNPPSADEVDAVSAQRGATPERGLLKCNGAVQGKGIYPGLAVAGYPVIT